MPRFSCPHSNFFPSSASSPERTDESEIFLQESSESNENWVSEERMSMEILS